MPSRNPVSPDALPVSDRGASDGSADISMMTASAMVVAAMVGTGVYVGLGHQVDGLPSGFPILLIWLLGGVWALCGSLCYAELSSMFPRSGGEYNLLGRAAHPLLGYLAGWISLVAGFVAPAALGASMFGSFLDGIFQTPVVKLPMLPAASLGRYAAVLALVLIALVQFGTLRMNSAFLNLFTWMKVLLILGIIVVAFGWAEPTGIRFSPVPGDARLIFSQSFGASLIYVSYAYSGWNTSTYIVGEVRNPQVNVPRSLLLGTTIVTVLYIGLNAAFLHATPIQAIQNLGPSEKETVALLAAEYIFGDLGGKLIAAGIALGLVSFIASMLWAGPRILQTIGEDYPLLSVFSRRNRFGSPAAAIAACTLIAFSLLLLDRFKAVLTYTQFVLVLSNVATVVAMAWLRITQPNRPRTCRVWGFPLVPLLFVTLAFVMLVETFRSAPMPTLWGTLTVILPIPLYFGTRCRRLASRQGEGGQGAVGQGEGE